MRAFGRRALMVVFALACAACGGVAEKDAQSSTDEQLVEGRRTQLYTHCGVTMNTTLGTWSETESGRAVFRSDSGKTAKFVAARPEQQDPNRGCE